MYRANYCNITLESLICEISGHGINKQVLRLKICSVTKYGTDQFKHLMFIIVCPVSTQTEQSHTQTEYVKDYKIAFQTLTRNSEHSNIFIQTKTVILSLIYELFSFF